MKYIAFISVILFVAALSAGVLAECGDGVLDSGEECDDGNLDDGDCCSSTCQSTGQPSGLVSYYNMDGQGSIEDNYQDADGQCVDTCPATSSESMINNSRIFNNNNQADITNTANFEWQNDSQFSIELWAMGTCVDTEVIMGRDDGPLHWWVGCNSDSEYRFYLFDSAHENGGNSDWPSASIPDEEWNHVVFVKDDEGLKIYVNGQLQSSVNKSYENDFVSDAKVTLGYLDGDHHFSGQLDELAIYDKALSLEEIQEHHQSNEQLKTNICLIGEEPVLTVPQINTDPVTETLVGQPYEYDVDATGYPEVTYSLLENPAGMNIDNSTGLIEWTATESGNYNVIVRATNTEGFDEQKFTVSVAEVLLAPEIVSNPITSVETDENYRYDVNATGLPDPNYVLQQYPENMAIDAVSGLIEWLAAEVGLYNVTVVANNSQGFDEQTFQINVTPEVNASPEITSEPVTHVVIENMYSYDVEATGKPEPLYSLSVFPENMVINESTGLIEWTATEVGLHNVTVVANNSEGQDVQTFVINVSDTEILAPEFVTDPVTSIEVYDTYTYQANATGEPSPIYVLLEAPENMTIDSTSGLIEWRPTVAGEYNVTVQAINDLGAFNQTFTINVSIPDSCQVAFECTEYTDCRSDESAGCLAVIDLSMCYEKTGDEQYVYDGNYSEFETACDYDSNGIAGTNDHIKHNLDTLQVAVERDTNLSRNFTGILSVQLMHGNESTVEFTYNFSSALDLGGITVEQNNNAEGNNYLLIKGIRQIGTKTVRFTKNNPNSNRLCIRDQEIDSADEISSDCSGEEEISITCDNTTQNGYTCQLTDGIFVVSGLEHSAIKEYEFTSEPAPTSGGGGRSSSSSTDEDNQIREIGCREDWVCNAWSSCEDGIKTRRCEDFAGCGTTQNMPADIMECDTLQEDESVQEEEGTDQQQDDQEEDLVTGAAADLEDGVQESTNYGIIALAVFLIVAAIGGIILTKNRG